jgi:type II secretory pathway predicted ATPase ExeA
MMLARNRSLWSRIHTRVHLGEASDADTAEYLEHRLRAAQASTSILTSDAIAMLHEASAGRLRDLDRIATETLKRAARRKLKKADRQLVKSTLDGDTID